MAAPLPVWSFSFAPPSRSPQRGSRPPSPPPPLKKISGARSTCVFGGSKGREPGGERGGGMKERTSNNPKQVAALPCIG
eukprot:2493335-Alexandrium_andersonii.AAC.2